MKTIDLLVKALPAIGGWPEKVTHIGQDYDRELMFYGRGNVRTGIILDQLAVDHRECGGVGTKITRDQYEAALAASKRCDHKWVPSEGRTQSGYLCSKCGNYDGPGYDWIDWPGGECPVPRGTLVDVRYRNGKENHHIGAGISLDDTGGDPDHNAEDWNNDDSPLDIIAYRLHKPQEAAQDEADEEADLNECIGQDAAPVWNGEGLPPVGCECEFISNDTSWGSVVVIGMDGDKVVIKPSGETYYGITPSEKQVFRPTRSEADRKRDEAVQALCDAGGGNGKVDEKAGYGSCWFDVYDAIAAGKIPDVKLED